MEFPGLVDAGRTRKVPIKVHLPGGTEAYPVVVLSHGAGGGWDANYGQAHHLASHGYVVLALEHVGSNTEVMKKGLRVVANLKSMIRDADEVLGRPRDVSFAIDTAEQWNESHDLLRGRLDLEQVGVLGHSYGAYTTMVVAGMRPALDWLQPAVAPGKGLGPDLSDARVDCGVALSPQGPAEPFFLEESYASLKVPFLGVSGSKDKQFGNEPVHRRRAFELWPPGDRYFIWLANADHVGFSDSTGSGRRSFRSKVREDVQPVVKAATLLFFDAYLKGDTQAQQMLTAETLQPFLTGKIDKVEVQKK